MAFYPDSEKRATRLQQLVDSMANTQTDVKHRIHRDPVKAGCWSRGGHRETLCYSSGYPSSSTPTNQTAFQSESLVASRIGRTMKRGEVDQCRTMVEPTTQTRRWGKMGNTGMGFGSSFRRHFQTCVQSYGEDETARV